MLNFMVYDLYSSAVALPKKVDVVLLDNTNGVTGAFQYSHSNFCKFNIESYSAAAVLTVLDIDNA